jgi:hypothetical protein
MINLTYEYRIYPNVQQAELMTQWLETCRKVYNYALGERRDWIKSSKCDINACSLHSEYIIAVDAPKPTYYQQKRNLSAARKVIPTIGAVHSQVLQDVMGRLEKAFNALWNSGQGFPRFKKRFRSFTFVQLGKDPIGKKSIKLPSIGEVATTLHRPVPDGFEAKQARVVRRPSGWYVQLILESNIEVPDIIPGGYPIGIDVGLNSFVATSEGELIARPRFFVEAQHRLKGLNRAVSRKKLPFSTTYQSLPNQFRLGGTYRSLSGTGNVAIGGSSSVAAWNTYTFSADGRVVRGGGAGASSGDVVTSSVAPNQRGRYQVEGSILRIRYDDGSVEEWIVIANPKDPKTAIWLDGNNYARRK